MSDVTLVFRDDPAGGPPLPALVRRPVAGLPTLGPLAHVDLPDFDVLPWDLRVLLAEAWREVAGTAPTAWPAADPLADLQWLAAPDWTAVIVRFLHKLSPRQPDPMDWDARGGPGVPRRGVPRARWELRPSLFFPPGVGERWHTNMTHQGLLAYKACFSFGMPRRLVEQGLRDQVLTAVVAPALGLDFVRLSHACPARAPAWEAELDPPPTGGKPAAELASAWLVDRLLNGMSPAALVNVGGGEVEARMSFRDLAFAPVATTRAKPYVLPDVAVRIGHDATGEAALTQIRLAYRDATGTYATPIVVTRADPPWRWFRAARAAASANFLAGQLDQHIARGHLVPEVVAVALDRAGVSGTHPVRRILGPRIAEIPGVNFAADGGIWGPDGVLSLCSPLTSDGLAKRMRDRLAGLDWRGYRPPSRSFAPSHHAPPALSGYWSDVVVPYVADALATLGGGLDAWWEANAAWTRQTRALFEALHGVPLPFTPWDGAVAFDTSGAWVDDAEFATGRAAGPTWSPLDEGDPKADVRQLCAFVIYHSTLAHTWANVRQTTDAGDPDFAVICLAARVDDPPPVGPTDDVWMTAARPAACDLAFQRAVGQTLTKVAVDTLADERHGRASTDLPRDPMNGPAALAARVEAWAPTRRGHPGPYADDWTPDLTTHLSRGNR